MTEKTKENWVTTKIRRTLNSEIIRSLKTEEAKKLGLTNTAQFVDSAIRELLEAIEQRRFSHQNTYEDKVRILDNNIGEMGDIVEVFLKDDVKKAFCGYCEKEDCVHVKYMWDLPQVTKILRNRGFHSPYGERLR